MLTRLAKALAAITVLTATACGADHPSDTTGGGGAGVSPGGVGNPGGGTANGGGVATGGNGVAMGGMLGNSGALGSGGLVGRGGMLGGGGTMPGMGGGVGTGGLAMGGSMSAGGAINAGGANAGGTINAGGMAGNAGGGGGPVLGPYPAAPYGNTVGATLANLKLSGYLDEAGTGFASDQPWLDAYSLEDVRATGAKYALVHVSQFF